MLRQEEENDKDDTKKTRVKKGPSGGILGCGGGRVSFIYPRLISKGWEFRWRQWRCRMSIITINL